jgi:hypothetical protein
MPPLTALIDLLSNLSICPAFTFSMLLIRRIRARQHVCVFRPLVLYFILVSQDWRRIERPLSLCPKVC